jgi:CRISPR-associated protein Csm3
MSAPKYFQRQLKGFVIFDIEFENRTGLLIRMPIQAQAYRIGGGDTYPMVTRRQYSGIGLLDVPYVPGSSFKGRMRSLLELALSKKFYTTDYRIWQHVRSLTAMNLDDFINDVLNRCIIDELFGYAALQYEQLAQLSEKARREGKAIDIDKVFSMLSVTRLIIDDFFPTEDYVKQIGAKSVADFLEEKSENRIDRITSAADPRDIVRVKPGVRFGGRITLLLFDNDADMIEKYLTTLATGLRLIEETYLGASGSRGYGRVKFSKIAVAVEKVQNVDGAPKLVEVPNIRKTYSNVGEFESDVKSLANAIKSAVFS